MDGEIRQAKRTVGPKAWLTARAERGAKAVAYDICELAKRDEVSFDPFDAFVTFTNRCERDGGLGLWLAQEWFGSPLHTSELPRALKLAWDAFKPAFEDALYDLRCR